MSASGGIFPAEDVFKHFVYPVPPHDSRVMNMSPKAYLQRLIDQGFIKDEHDQNIQGIRAVTNRLVRVHGRFKPNGTFSIHLVESSPPPTEAPPQCWPIRVVAILDEGMYCLRGLQNMPGKIEFAGKPSEVWSKYTLNERAVWRVVFGQKRGRREGTKERFENGRQALDFVLSLIRQRDSKGRTVGIAEIAEMLDREKPVKRTKSDRDPRSKVRSLQRLYKEMKLQSWDEVIQLARTHQKKLPS